MSHLKPTCYRLPFAAALWLYTLGGAVPVSTLYYDDKSDPDKSYAPRSRAYIDGLVARAQR